MFNLTPTVRNLLIANIILLVITTSMSNIPVAAYGALFPIGSQFFYPWQLLTYMFLHAGWMHLISNMFGLISFGPLLEQRWGGQRFLFFWLVCGFGAGLLYEGVRFYELRPLTELKAAILHNPNGAEFSELVGKASGSGLYEGDDFALATALERNPNDATLRADVVTRTQDIYQQVLASPMVGASGALFGILFAFAYLFPNTELMLLFFPFPIKAKYFVGLYALYELYNGVHRTPGDNVAHFAHLGGLLIGFIVLKVWERGRERFY